MPGAAAVDMPDRGVYIAPRIGTIHDVRSCHRPLSPTAQGCMNKVASKKKLIRFLQSLAETMEIPPRDLAAATLEYANGVFGDPGDPGATEPEVSTPETGRGETTFPPVEPYTGPIHLCLDFGTAMSKAFAWNKDSDSPMPLRIGYVAGEPGSSPYALNSTIFISREGRVFFGQKAVDKAVADPEHQAFQSL